MARSPCPICGKLFYGGIMQHLADQHFRNLIGDSKLKIFECVCGKWFYADGRDKGDFVAHVQTDGGTLRAHFLRHLLGLGRKGVDD